MFSSLGIGEGFQKKWTKALQVTFTSTGLFVTWVDEGKDCADCLIRCSPGEDATNGFFVSCFVRASNREDTRKRKREADGALTPSSTRKRKQKKSDRQTEKSSVT
jgi:hypothetical protein